MLAELTHQSVFTQGRASRYATLGGADMGPAFGPYDFAVRGDSRSGGVSCFPGAGAGKVPGVGFELSSSALSGGGGGGGGDTAKEILCGRGPVGYYRVQVLVVRAGGSPPPPPWDVIPPPPPLAPQPPLPTAPDPARDMEPKDQCESKSDYDDEDALPVIRLAYFKGGRTDTDNTQLYMVCQRQREHHTTLLRDGNKDDDDISRLRHGRRLLGGKGKYVNPYKDWSDDTKAESRYAQNESPTAAVKGDGCEVPLDAKMFKGGRSFAHPSLFTKR